MSIYRRGTSCTCEGANNLNPHCLHRKALKVFGLVASVRAEAKGGA
ncbi:MAG: hypothetical protein WKF75_05950 [Singulisphaera sp.]